MLAAHDCGGVKTPLYHLGFDEISARQSHSPSKIEQPDTPKSLC